MLSLLWPRRGKVFLCKFTSKTRWRQIFLSAGNISVCWRMQFFVAKAVVVIMIIVILIVVIVIIVLFWSSEYWPMPCHRINKLQHSDALKHYDAVFVKSGQKIICFETLSQIDWKSTKQLILAILFLTQKENRWSMHWTVLSGKSRNLSTSNCTLSSSITVSARNISLSVNRRPPRNELCWEHSAQPRRVEDKTKLWCWLIEQNR